MSREARRDSLVHLSTSGQASPGPHPQRNEVIDRLNEIIVVPVTRTIRGLTTEIVLTPDDGMPVVCALNFDHVSVAQRDRIGGVLCSLPETRWAEVRRALMIACGFGLQKSEVMLDLHTEIRNSQSEIGVADGAAHPDNSGWESRKSPGLFMRSPLQGKLERAFSSSGQDLLRTFSVPPKIDLSSVSLPRLIR